MVFISKMVKALSQIMTITHVQHTNLLQSSVFMVQACVDWIHVRGADKGTDSSCAIVLHSNRAVHGVMIQQLSKESSPLVQIALCLV